MVGKRHPKVQEYRRVSELRQEKDRKEKRSKIEKDRKELEEKIKEGKEEVDLMKKPKKHQRPPGRDERDISIAEKDLLWEQFFNIRRFFTKSQIERGECKFAHRIVTDGVSISASHFRPGAKKIQKGRIPKQFRKKERFGDKELEDLSKLDFKDIDLKRIVGVDPGKHTILHLTNETSPKEEQEEERKTLKYTAGQRRHESKSTRRNRRLAKDKPDNIQRLEDTLSETNSRSPSVTGFKKYLAARFKVQEDLYSYYGQIKFRVCRWKIWKDRRRSEDKLISNIGKTFGENVILAYGTWGQWSRMKGLASSPTTGLKRRIAQRYTVIDTSEYNTTRTCSRCHTLIKGDPSRMKKRKNSDIWDCLRSIRLCWNKDYCGGFLRWDRDHNAAINIRAQLIHRLEFGFWSTLQSSPRNARGDSI